MAHQLLKQSDIFMKDKFGIQLEVYPDISNVGLVTISTETGHNQEFYHKVSTFHYIVLEGKGIFYLDDQPVDVSQGDMLSVQPGTRVYYRGNMRLILITDPAWREEDEVEIKCPVWDD